MDRLPRDSRGMIGRSSLTWTYAGRGHVRVDGVVVVDVGDLEDGGRALLLDLGQLVEALGAAAAALGHGHHLPAGRKQAQACFSSSAMA